MSAHASLHVMDDLFGFAESMTTLPVKRGKTDTSAEAAACAQTKATIYREAALAKVKAAGGKGLTCSEAAHKMRLHITTVRPRFTDLKDLGLISDSGLRRANRGGRNEIVWVHSS